jgi:hypothetical protein
VRNRHRTPTDDELERRAIDALSTLAADRAPQPLRESLAAARTAQRPSRRWQLRPVLLAPLALAIALIAAVLLPGGGVGSPTLAQAAALASRSVIRAVASPNADGAALLPMHSSAGVPYPYWDDRFGFAATGMRSDRLGDRTATTVFYSRASDRIAYTIVSGPPLATGRAARSVLLHGTHLRVLRLDGRLVVVWLRRGHTCVLSGARTSVSVLSRLAAWKAGGRVPF